MAFYDLLTTTLDNITLNNGDIIECRYSGNYKELKLPKGRYLFDCYGAQGGTVTNAGHSNMISGSDSPIITTHLGGLGGRIYGEISVVEDTVFYLYVGGEGLEGCYQFEGILPGGWNGGGSVSNAYFAGSGGGATDIRLSHNLEDRIIVAGAGGGGCVVGQSLETDKYFAFGGAGGGIKADSGSVYNTLESYNCTVATGGSQTEGGIGASITGSYTAQQGETGSLGVGGAGTGNITKKQCGGGGGGGYYGGGGGTLLYTSGYGNGVFSSGAGGSSFASTAFSNTIHEQGTRKGDGLIRITVLDSNNEISIYVKNNGRILQSSKINCKVGNDWYIADALYAKVNNEWTECGKQVHTQPPLEDESGSEGSALQRKLYIYEQGKSDVFKQNYGAETSSYGTIGYNSDGEYYLYSTYGNLNFVITNWIGPINCSGYSKLIIEYNRNRNVSSSGLYVGYGYDTDIDLPDSSANWESYLKAVDNEQGIYVQKKFDITNIDSDFYIKIYVSVPSSVSSRTSVIAIKNIWLERSPGLETDSE